MWLVPLTNATVTVAVGAIAKRPVLVEGGLQEREHLCLTVSFDHDITIPMDTHFQFRSFGYEPLAALGVTMPPWPGEGEAYFVEGKWESTVESGPA